MVQLLDDEHLCIALGMDSDGMCLRHPNIHIAMTITITSTTTTAAAAAAADTSTTSTDDTGNHDKNNDNNNSINFHPCRICQSELGTTNRDIVTL
jgi:hypothetical protein